MKAAIDDLTNQRAVHAKYATVRFEDGSACCTTTYCHKLSNIQKNQLAERVALALNAVRDLSLEQLREFVAASGREETYAQEK